MRHTVEKGEVRISWHTDTASADMSLPAANCCTAWSSTDDCWKASFEGRSAWIWVNRMSMAALFNCLLRRRLLEGAFWLGQLMGRARHFF